MSESYRSGRVRRTSSLMCSTCSSSSSFLSLSVLFFFSSDWPMRAANSRSRSFCRQKWLNYNFFLFFFWELCKANRLLGPSLISHCHSSILFILSAFFWQVLYWLHHMRAAVAFECELPKLIWSFGVIKPVRHELGRKQFRTQNNVCMCFACAPTALSMILPLPVVEWRHQCRCRSSSSGPLYQRTALQHTQPQVEKV